MRSLEVSVLCLSSLLAPAALAQFHSMRLPGDPSGRGTNVTGLSADGQVAVGTIFEGSTFHAHRWTRSGGRESIGEIAGIPSIATGVSGDGRVVVGYRPATPSVHEVPLRWTREDSFVTIPIVSGDYGLAFGANGDGSVIVGSLGRDRANVLAGFYWTQAGGMLVLDDPVQAPWCTVAGVSDDGVTLVGEHWQYGAFRWTVAGGFQYVNQESGGSSECLGLNRDASILVGWLPDRSGAMWTSSGVVNLGKLPGTSIFRASEVNDAGTIVAGYSEVGVPAQQFIATIWTVERGLERLSTYLAAKGISVPDTLDLVLCTAMSADGRVLGGSAIDRNDRLSRIGFVVEVGDACLADFNDDEFLDFFDYLGFVEAFEAGDPQADFNRDGFTDFFDYAAFVAEFETGC